MPEYRAADDLVTIGGDLTVHECPVSYITPKTKEILNQILQARHVYRASGASLFGADLSQWPPWAVEAMSCVENEHIAVENAINEARFRGGGAPEQD